MNHHPRKRFGQNFLHDPAIIQRIVRNIDPRPGQHLVEIGPGKGAITRPLLETAGALDVVELDRDLIPPLAQQCSNLGRLRIHSADARRFDFCALAGPSERLRVVGNLPYNISTPLLFHLLDQTSCIEDMHFMLQKEVVERMAAPSGNKTYGRLSVMVQVRCRVTPLFTIAPGAFQPRPKVDSMLVRLQPYTSPIAPIVDFDTFARLVNHAFSRRRKTLRNALRGVLSEEQIEAAGIDPSLRPERIDIVQFARLANVACSRDETSPLE